MRIGVMVGPERGRYATKVERLRADARWAEEAGLSLGLDPADPRRVRRPHRRRRSSAPRPAASRSAPRSCPSSPATRSPWPSRRCRPRRCAAAASPSASACRTTGSSTRCSACPTSGPAATHARPPRRARPGPRRARARSTSRTSCFRVHNPLDITDVTPTPVLLAALGPADAAPRRRAHRRHHPLDGRRAGHRLATSSPTSPRPPRRAGRPAPRIVAGIPVCLCGDDEVDVAVARTNRILSEAEVSPNYQRLLDHGDAQQRRRHPRRRQRGDRREAPAVLRRRRRHRPVGPRRADRRRPRRAAGVDAPHPRATSRRSPARSDHRIAHRGGTHARTHPRHPGVRRRQPPLRDAGRAHEVPARPLQGRRRLRRRAGPHEDRRPGPDQRVHPQPHLRRRGPARRQEDYFRNGNPEGKSRREIFGEPMRAIPAFREPAPRVELMDEQGIDRALMFPTLASLVEERMRDDPELTHAVIHALNEWMHETWTFDYEGRIFATPVITLPIVEKAIEELEWVRRAGRQGRAHPAGAGVRATAGPRSFGLPEFDPFWEKVVEHDILVAMHSSDSGYERYANEWMGSDSEMLPFQPQAFRMLGAWRPVEDAVAVAHLPRRAVALPAAEGGGHRERQQLGRAAAQEPGRRLQEDAAGLPRGPGRGLQAQHLRQPVLGGGPRRPGRAHRRRPRAVRLRLPAPRGPGRPGQLRRRARGRCPRRPSARSWAATWPG